MSPWAISTSRSIEFLARCAAFSIAVHSLLLITGCSQTVGLCPSPEPVNLGMAISYQSDDNLPFRFPVDDVEERLAPFSANFSAFGVDGNRVNYHTGEDISRPVGTPVFAMAAGTVSFSGRCRKYGWLVVIEHPEFNMYSLYGHLNRNMWRVEPGPVEKGDPIGYIGNYDSERPFLHFGVRIGQPSDYPALGRWRWSAEWLRSCPQEVGWLQPSKIIVAQGGPTEEFTATHFFIRFRAELLLFGIVLLGSISLTVLPATKSLWWPIAVDAVLVFAGGLILRGLETAMGYPFLVLAGVMMAFGLYRLLNRAGQRGNNP